MKYKHTATFNATIFASSDLPEFEKECKESLASLGEIAPYNNPDDVDLLSVAFDGAVINQFNGNDDGLDSSIAVRIKDRFEHKPINVEHDRSRIIGHITNAVFTDRSSKEIIWADNAKRLDSPYNLTLGGFVYKMVNSEFYEELKDSMDNMSPNYQSISASWEVGFNTFGVALGSQEIQHCEIITDPIEVARLAPNLKSFGGDGYTEDGRRAYRLILGDVYPLGMGFVKKPAADVKGVYGIEAEEDMRQSAAECDKERAAAAKKECFIANKEEDISQSEKRDVKSPDQIISMDLLTQLKEALANQEKVTEEVAASITKQFADLIRESDESYRKQLDEKEQAIVAKEEKREALENTVASLEEQVNKQAAELKEFKEAKAAEELQNAINQRMETIDSLYELDNEDRKVIFEDLAGIDVASDEAFQIYAGRLAVILRHKNKEAVAKAAQEAADAKDLKEAKASQEDTEVVDDKEALEKAEASAEAKAPNNNGGDASESLVSRYGKAFSEENVKIST